MTTASHAGAQPYRVIVVGLGAVGSAAAYYLARRGWRVTGLDRFAPPHPHGSTHGRSRIIREAYFEHPLYVPLVRRAYECWDEIEGESGRRLFVRTGGLMVGPRDGTIFGGALASARAHGVPHEVLSADAARRRFPGLAVPDEHLALLEPNAGVLDPEGCVQTCLALAERHGATLHAGAAVTGWGVERGEVVVAAGGREYRADRLVLAAGPWMPQLLADLAPPLEVERQLFHWFAPAAHAERFAPERCPIVLWEYAPDRLVATFPDLGDGVKIGVHHGGEVVANPEDVRRTVSPDEDEAVRALLARLMPDAAGALRDSAVCLYTNTPDHHFLIDAHPAHPEVLLASPCSGHGFKFASAVGEVLADLVTLGWSAFDLAPFALARFAGRPAAGAAGRASAGVGPVVGAGSA